MKDNIEKECANCKHFVFGDEDWYGNYYYVCELNQDEDDCTKFEVDNGL